MYMKFFVSICVHKCAYACSCMHAYVFLWCVQACVCVWMCLCVCLCVYVCALVLLCAFAWLCMCRVVKTAFFINYLPCSLPHSLPDFSPSHSSYFPPSLPLSLYPSLPPSLHSFLCSDDELHTSKQVRWTVLRV